MFTPLEGPVTHGGDDIDKIPIPCRKDGGFSHRLIRHGGKTPSFLTGFTDTICAIATPPGEGGIGIIRLSGPESLDVLKKIFSPAKKTQRKFENKKLVYGYIYDISSQKRVDEVLAVYMKAPFTYTGEDIAEIQAHGGVVSLKRILNSVLSCGARLADPGEFTKRAFLNSRIDLSQAEAVADLIKAKTDHSSTVALSQLQGRLSRVIKDLRKEILNYLALMEAHIDFCEEDLPPLDLKKLKKNLNRQIQSIERLIQQAKEGKIFRQGVLTVIVGRPNVGKSTLLNKLLQQERAIVTKIPGTTRDTLEEWVNLKEIPFKLIDTAGLRQTKNEIEKLGVDRTKTAISQADLILLMIDISENLTPEDRQIINSLKQKKCLVVLNKIDLGEKQLSHAVKKQLEKFNGTIKTSLIQEDGLERLKSKMVQLVSGSDSKPAADFIISNIRHQRALEKAKEYLEKATESLKAGLPVDFLTIDLKAALKSLGEVTGETITEDIINQIFSEFCIGK